MSARILVVDDSPTIRKVVCSILEASAFASVSAQDGQEALEILAKRSMGAATDEAQTFGGQLKQLGEVWNDLLKETGNAIIANDGGTSCPDDPSPDCTELPSP